MTDGIIIGLLLALFYQGASLVFPEGRKTGVLLMILSVVGLILWSKKTIQVPAFSFFRYGAVALPLSVVMAIVSEYRLNIKVVRDGRSVSDAIREFARECAARRLPTLTEKQKLEERKWEKHEYSRRFDHELYKLNCELALRGITSEGTLRLFQNAVAPTQDSPTDLYGAADLLKGLTQQVRLAHCWVWRRALIYVVGYWVLSLILWLGLLAIRHV